MTITIESHTRHWFTSLWWHFGEYGDQTVHVHSCLGDADVIDADLAQGIERDMPPCDWVVIGVGRSCGGKQTRHWRQSLEARVEAQSAWSALEDQ